VSNRALVRAADATLEGSVILSFLGLGYRIRQRLGHWSSPAPLSQRWVVITGATSGLGLFTARAAAELGANLVLVGRDQDRLRRTRDEMRASCPSVRIEGLVADMASLADVRRLAGELTAITPVIDVLVHNAGAISDQWTASPEGIETTVAAQVLGPFLLTQLLVPALEQSQPGRVLTVTSGGMYTWKFVLDDLLMRPNGYDGVMAYARAKRAQVLLAHEWARRTRSSDILFATVHPGWTDTPGLAHALPAFYRFLRPWLRTPAEGADTLLWLMGSDQLETGNGRLFFDRRVRGEHKIPVTRSGDQLLDQNLLWEWCVKQTSL